MQETAVLLCEVCCEHWSTIDQGLADVRDWSLQKDFVKVKG